MSCQEPIDIPNVANTILQDAHVLLMGDSMAWQLYQLLHCLYTNHHDNDATTATTNNTIHFDFQPLHVFPVRANELETAIDNALQSKQPYRNYSALIIAMGTWYNWDWGGQNDDQHIDNVIDPDGPAPQQSVLPQVFLETILRDQCPDGRAATYFHNHPLGNNNQSTTTNVYEYAQHMRALCGPLLRREAYIAGLTMLRNVIAQRRRGGANDETNNDKAWPVVLWKQVSVQHFNTASGNFDIIGGGTDQHRSSLLSGCVPLRNNTLNYERNRVAETVLLQHHDRDRRNNKNNNNVTSNNHHDDRDDNDTDDDAANDLSSPPPPLIRIIPTYELEMTAYDQHVSLHDCTHYCNPSPTMLNGVDATMTQLLTARLRRGPHHPTINQPSN
jgi:hypothetical protein